MSVHRPGRILRAVLRAPATLYDWRLGWLFGHRFIRLSHTGRRSGRRYQTMLEVLQIHPETGEIVVAAGLGKTTDWLRNVQAGGPVEVAIGVHRFPVRDRILDVSEAVSVLTDYEHRNRLIAPLVRRMLSWLVGWPYDSSTAARHRLVRQLPMIALHAVEPTA